MADFNLYEVLNKENIPLGEIDSVRGFTIGDDDELCIVSRRYIYFRDTAFKIPDANEVIFNYDKDVLVQGTSYNTVNLGVKIELDDSATPPLAGLVLSTSQLLVMPHDKKTVTVTPYPSNANMGKVSAQVMNGIAISVDPVTSEDGSFQFSTEYVDIIGNIMFSSSEKGANGQGITTFLPVRTVLDYYVIPFDMNVTDGQKRRFIIKKYNPEDTSLPSPQVTNLTPNYNDLNKIDTNTYEIVAHTGLGGHVEARISIAWGQNDFTAICVIWPV